VALALAAGIVEDQHFGRAGDDDLSPRSLTT